MVNLRNLAMAELQPGPTLNGLTGPNGAGKTTVLDAVHYLCMGKSFINAIDSQNIRQGQPMLGLHGKFVNPDGPDDEVSLGFQPGGKKTVKRNGKELERLADHIGQFFCVVVSPLDTELVLGGSEDRRRFLDSILGQTSRSYLQHLVHYNRALAQRNALLKHFHETRSFQPESLALWDQRLAHHGQAIYSERVDFIEKLTAEFDRIYALLSAQAETVGVTYESPMHQNNLAELLGHARQRDLAAGTTTVGPHKDDLVLTINQNQALKRAGSMGQQKTALVSLRLAQFTLMTQATGISPILLLDDVFDRLDPQRVGRLLEMVSTAPFGQVFITHTDEKALHHLLEDLQVSWCEVKNGLVTQK